MSAIKKSPTQSAIDETVQKLLLKNSLEKITVRDICNYCGIDRQLFYYYYRDKFDCVNSRYRTDVDEIVAVTSQQHSWENVVCHILEYIGDNGSYYRAAFKYSGQNSFLEYFTDYSYNLNHSVVNTQYELHDTDQDILFAIDFYNNGCVYAAYKWVKNGMKESPSFVARNLKQSVPKLLTQYYL